MIIRVDLYSIGLFPVIRVILVVSGLTVMILDLVVGLDQDLVDLDLKCFEIWI